MSEYFPQGKGDCDVQGNPTCVSNLFDPWGEYRKKGISIKEIALGSMLHTVQDSFTKSHVNRDNNGKIVSFYSYVNQNGLTHAKEDGLPKWLRTGKWPDINPVSVSEVIIRKYLEYKRTGQDNSKELMNYIKEIYLPAEKTKMSGPGLH